MHCCVPNQDAEDTKCPECAFAAQKRPGPTVLILNPTGSVLQCTPDSVILQQRRTSFEAVTLLMCAAACGNVHQLDHLLAAG